MKKGTKITVFLASMALTLGSLFAFIGPRQCGHGMYRHGAFMQHNFENGSCEQGTSFHRNDCQKN